MVTRLQEHGGDGLWWWRWWKVQRWKSMQILHDGGGGGYSGGGGGLAQLVGGGSFNAGSDTFLISGYNDDNGVVANYLLESEQEETDTFDRPRLEQLME